jgi:5'-nucleotidase (lipoprotein e(P4) family)
MTKHVIAAIGIVGILTTTASCRSTTAPPVRTPQPAAAAAPASTLPDSLRWVRDSAEYRAATLQAYRAAGASVATLVHGRQPGSWAVVLDADETVISNLQYQIERAQAGLPFTTETWHAWVVRREATPMAGAAPFLSRVRDLGGRIAIVTNRLESECADTEAVFKTHLMAYDMMLCRPDDGPSDKNPRFAAVAAGTTKAGGPPLDVVAFLGDNILDFPNLSQAAAKKADTALEAFGVKYFMLPNPMYGSWQ